MNFTQKVLSKLRNFRMGFLYEYSLPDFVIIGTNKGGTTFLYRTLALHPNVYPAVRKEIHFFDNENRYSQGLDWYRKNFAIPKFKYFRHKLPKSFLIGEASPMYICHPRVPERIFKALPNIKFIVLLRNPIERAYSHFNHIQQSESKWRDNRSFEQAIEDDFKWIKKTKPEHYINTIARTWWTEWCSYVARGIYVIQLKRWFSFFSKEQFIIIKSEDMLKNPFFCYGQVTNFLGLPEWYPKKMESIHKRSYSNAINPNTRRRLVDFYKPYNEQLYNLIGVDFGWT